MTQFAAAGGLLLGGLLGAGDARARNRAVRNTYEAEVESARATSRQLAEDTALRRRRNINAQRRVEGQIIVESSERGVGLGGSAALLRLASDADADLNARTLNLNLSNRLTAVASGLDATRTSLGARLTPVGLAALDGALTGFTTGLSLGGSIETLATPAQAPSTRTPGAIP